MALYMELVIENPNSLHDNVKINQTFIQLLLWDKIYLLWAPIPKQSLETNFALITMV